MKGELGMHAADWRVGRKAGLWGTHLGRSGCHYLATLVSPPYWPGAEWLLQDSEEGRTEGASSLATPPSFWLSNQWHPKVSVGNKVNNLSHPAKSLEWWGGSVLQVLPRAYLGNEDEAVDCGCANKDTSRCESIDQVGPGVQVSGDHKKKPRSQHHEVDPNHDG